MQSSVAENNTSQSGIVGYATKASESLPYTIRLLGSTTDWHGKKTYHYTTRIGHGLWENNKNEIEELNEHSEITSIFGKAGFPTNKNTNSDELKMIYQHKKTFGIEDKFIHGERSWNRTTLLNCDDGRQFSYPSKHTIAAAYPVWRVDHLVI